MSFLEEYKQKLVSADEAVKIVKSGDWVDYGWCTGTPDALDKALARRTDELKDVNVRGMAFAFHTETARKEGFRTDILRGEDGSLALALKKYGKLRFVTARKARVLTGYGTVSADGSLFSSFKKRAIKGLRSFTALFYSINNYEDEDSNLIK